MSEESKGMYAVGKGKPNELAIFHERRKVNCSYAV